MCGDGKESFRPAPTAPTVPEPPKEPETPEPDWLELYGVVIMGILVVFVIGLCAGAILVLILVHPQEVYCINSSVILDTTKMVRILP